MNTCDHGHETHDEIRRLPLGRDPYHGNILVCRRHFDHEMAFRRERATSTGADKWDFPTWESLAVDQRCPWGPQ